MKAFVRIGAVALIAIVHLVTAQPVSAQVTSAQVYGTIKDAQGAVIPGATLVLVSESRGTRSAPVVSSATGDFVFPNITPDMYTLEVSMSGFKSWRRAGIAVSPGDRIAVPAITLDVGGQSETVNVQAESPTTRPTAANVRLRSPPKRSRTCRWRAAAFQPGALCAGHERPQRQRDEHRPPRRRRQHELPDGRHRHHRYRQQHHPAHDDIDAIAEVKALTGSFQAEYGRASGMQIAAVTKSGTNRFRGGAYALIRNSDWNENSWANQQNGNPKNVVKERDWGYTLGGPIGSPAAPTSCSSSFAGMAPARDLGSIARFRVPTLAERSGDFSQSRDNNGNLYNLVRDASTGLPCKATNTTGCFQDGGVIGRSRRQAEPARPRRAELLSVADEDRPGNEHVQRD